MFDLDVLIISSPYVIILCEFIFIALIVACFVFVFRNIWQSDTVWRRISINGLTVLSALSVFYISAEIFFSYIYVLPDNFGMTLSCKRWYHLYWNQINSYGYRDYEPDWSKNSVVIVGDSFTAGQGIENIDQRFSNLLGSKLSAKWDVTVAAQPGWHARDYINALKRLDHKPNKIIISYFVNDIEGAAIKNGVPIFIYPKNFDRSVFEKGPISKSYFLNWVFWRFFSGRQLFVGDDALLTKAKDAVIFSYENEVIWKEHTRELDQIISLARNKLGAEVFFVFWPHLANIPLSETVIRKVQHFVESRGVRTLDLSSTMKEYNPDKMMVSAYDAHPDEKAHFLAAEALYAELTVINFFNPEESASK